MYLCTKFQLIWRTSDFGTIFAQKNVSDKNFEKMNIKFEIRILAHELEPKKLGTWLCRVEKI